MSDPITTQDVGFSVICLIVAFALVIGMAIGGCIRSDHAQRKAIEAGVGQFNSKTGDFEFIKPEKKAEK